MSFSKISLLLLIIVSIISGGFTLTQNSADAATQSATTRLPIGQDTFKIELNETGLYEITYAMLQTAGMDVDNIDPNRFEMMSAGTTVAYEWLGDNDSTFESHEKIRFFGSAYNGSRFEKQYIENNVYWLWANGTPTRINTAANETNHAQVSYWTSREHFGEDRMFDFTDTNYDAGWAFVEADSWFWYVLAHNTAKTVEVNLTNLVDVGVDAAYSIEVFSKKRIVNAVHQLQATINNAQTVTFNGTNVAEAMVHSNTIPVAQLNNGRNDFVLKSAAPVSNDHMFLNEIIVTYTRSFGATDDELLFEYTLTGGATFEVDNLSIADVVVWDVSDMDNPVAIALSSQDIDETDGVAVKFGRILNGASKFLVTTPNNIKSPTLSKYVPVELNPTGGADWVAVTYHELEAEIGRLARHRTNTNRIKTHVVDVEDVINQYGFGYPIPAAIHSYIQAGYQEWAKKPRYLLLAGDATINPRQRPCLDTAGGACSFPWNTTDQDFVPTYLLHHDPFVGFIPSDHPYSLLAGDDLIPEIAVGRLTVGNSDIQSSFNTTEPLDEQMRVIIDKIITYDTGVIAKDDWTRRMVFLADDADAGGAFCFENQNAADLIPDDFAKESFCYDDYKLEYESNPVGELRTDFFRDLNNNSAAIVNYRGHGSVINWGNNIVTRDDNSRVRNSGQPFVILSADCLDNYFGFNNLISMSEAFMRVEDAGSAAHWGSTGLGFSWEHTILHNAFYDGLYEKGLNTIGDAIVHAKAVYEESPGSRSELYAFTLQGDPAMRMPTITPEIVHHEVFIPIVMNPYTDIPIPFPRTTEE